MSLTVDTIPLRGVGSRQNPANKNFSPSTPFLPASSRLTIMDSLSETLWDVVISGTGLQQSLLALALSRSGKNILHVDSNGYYGGSEAALSLQEADEWAERHQSAHLDGAFAAAQVTKAEDGLSFSRAYSLALAPQLIHARSELLSQLVSSKAFRQIEFLAVGSFYIFQPPSASNASSTLVKIPSTREEVFATKAISPRSKRSLMKFIKFVLEYELEPRTEVWKSKSTDELAGFLESEFKLDGELKSFVTVLALSIDGKISVEAGLAAIHRHLTSMGLFGRGFAAVYPKWGGLSEIAQVGCRAGAVGGAIYMLGTGLADVQDLQGSDDAELSVKLADGMHVRAKALVRGTTKPLPGDTIITRLTVVVESTLASMFESSMENGPKPCVAVVGFPPGSIKGSGSSEFPIYAFVHSSDTGECPNGQSTIYLSTVACAGSKDLLEEALSSLLKAASSDQEQPKCLYRLSYEQRGGSGTLAVEDKIGTFAMAPLDLAFSDSVLSPVKEAWKLVVAGDTADDDETYMKFDDREGVVDDEDAFRG
ncbi:hypothetical protein HIM_05717 [Hirsutella minnesotensis 3608]|uniref:Rab proteins geranylgeranyltransferase n=1 Tax=Hirsutella minnesotensis 3608 TaxID=1043627 RepID=A0A0F7ZUG2_9HYPO|nr:hypothetical protein HIM_05717 [Hirsutella minnesotensis 3608]